MTFDAALATIGARSDDPEALAQLAQLALAEMREEEAVPFLLSAARRSGDARLWQWTGLLHRSTGDLEPALDAFGQAARVSPADPSIAHGFARVSLEAGLDARKAFEAALRLDPAADVLIGWTAALYAEGQGGKALDQLGALLGRNPGWGQGHVQWAQLASMTGRSGDAMTTIERALAEHPREASLWDAALHILTAAERHQEAWRLADRAIAATGEPARYALPRAGALSDAGELAEAAAAFEALGQPLDVGHAVLKARHLIRAHDVKALVELTDRWMGGESAHRFWPYASIAWRLAGDPREEWLEGDDRLVSVLDLGDIVPLDAIARRLRGLHQRSGRFLDQSVRGGTQTDGPLLSRIDPEIRALRSAIVDAVMAYRDQLPPIDPGHPMLRHRRDTPVRFAGSWSVRLAGQGHHSNHVHPQGWISSAFYVSVPESLDEEEGWLSLGEPQAELATSLAPIRRIAPRPGRLILFPSMMWHGTLPFRTGERLTVAFDVAPPR